MSSGLECVARPAERRTRYSDAIRQEGLSTLTSPLEDSSASSSSSSGQVPLPASESALRRPQRPSSSASLVRRHPPPDLPPPEPPSTSFARDPDPYQLPNLPPSWQDRSSTSFWFRSHERVFADNLDPRAQPGGPSTYAALDLRVKELDPAPPPIDPNMFEFPVDNQLNRDCCA